MQNTMICSEQRCRTFIPFTGGACAHVFVFVHSWKLFVIGYFLVHRTREIACVIYYAMHVHTFAHYFNQVENVFKPNPPGLLHLFIKMNMSVCVRAAQCDPLLRMCDVHEIPLIHNELT